MGVNICANNRKCDIELDMAYSTFNRMRDMIGKFVADPIYSIWKQTDEKTPVYKLDEICANFIKTVGHATYNFLTQCDCEGSLSYKECKELLNTIKDLHVETLFGYIYNARTIDDFKTLLQYCYSHRTKLVWG